MPILRDVSRPSGSFLQHSCIILDTTDSTCKTTRFSKLLLQVWVTPTSTPPPPPPPPGDLILLQIKYEKASTSAQMLHSPAGLYVPCHLSSEGLLLVSVSHLPPPSSCPPEKDCQAQPDTKESHRHSLHLLQETDKLSNNISNTTITTELQ